MNNNYKVASSKMTSRFGMSNKDIRAESKYFATYYGDMPSEGGSRRLKYATKRLAKKCPHKLMIDRGHGGPNGGCIDLLCKDCGYRHHVSLY